jgi:aconitate hydratase
MAQALNVTQKLIHSHLLSGKAAAGEEIGLRIDQTLTQDATGTMVMLELEAMNLKKVKTELSVQYVDHNLLQADFRNADDQIFLKSASQRFGLWYSRPGNGVSHPVHMERFAIPGKTLAGSDSHTPASGAMGMLALGAGGLDVAFVMMGEPLFIKMPKILGVRLTGKLNPWVSAKDVVLEMLRRYNVQGCRGMIIEYFGPGLEALSAMDRHVIANMGTEMGATTTVFPSDQKIKRFLISQKRSGDWKAIVADNDGIYDLIDELDLSSLQPLIALPSSPGNVVSVKEVEGTAISQVVLGSSANPGLRDFWVAAQMLEDRKIHPDISLDINPTSRQMMENLVAMNALTPFYRAGGRVHQAGCLGCIGMGQAPASGNNSLRTVPRNFPGRSGTLDDRVYLCSPETAIASALTGYITDPRSMEKLFKMRYPVFVPPEKEIINTDMLLPPPKDGSDIELQKGPNILSLPKFDRIKDSYTIPVLLKMGDNISTDEILKAGVKALSYRSNIPEISKWTYSVIREHFNVLAMEAKTQFGGHIVVAGENYAQGSSREHAAIAPRYLGQIAVLAKSYARLGWQNLINFGILPFEFEDPNDYNSVEEHDVIKFENLLDALNLNTDLIAVNKTKNIQYRLKHSLSERQIRVVLAGGVINYFNMPSKTAVDAPAISDG